MELRHLEYFVAVAEERNFTRAAERLHVVQSGVSASIRKLERDLGAELFDRGPRQVVLTSAGEALLPAARATLAAAAEAREVVAAAAGTLRGRIAVGTIQSARPLDLPALLGRFHARHPDVTVHLRHGPDGSSVLAQELRDGLLDVAFLPHPDPLGGDLDQRRLADHAFVLIVPRSHRLAGRAFTTLADLAGETFVDLAPGYGHRVSADRAFEDAGVRRLVAFEVADPDTIPQLVVHGLGIALVPSYSAAGLEDVHAVRIRQGGPRRVLFVASTRAKASTPIVRALMADIEAASAGLREPGDHQT